MYSKYKLKIDTYRTNICSNTILIQLILQINLLIEELGLEQVRDTNVGRLTRSEIRRLNVACQLLLDMAVLILDQPTKEMDIFDTFFLVEYLRNWASTGRVVIMSLHPPTYEIFAMLTKVYHRLHIYFTKVERFYRKQD